MSRFSNIMNGVDPSEPLRNGESGRFGGRHSEPADDVPDEVGYRGGYFRDPFPSPRPEGYEDVHPKAFVKLGRGDESRYWHRGAYYRPVPGSGNDKPSSWAARFSGEGGGGDGGHGSNSNNGSNTQAGDYDDY